MIEGSFEIKNHDLPSACLSSVFSDRCCMPFFAHGSTAGRSSMSASFVLFRSSRIFFFRSHFLFSRVRIGNKILLCHCILSVLLSLVHLQHEFIVFRRCSFGTRQLWARLLVRPVVFFCSVFFLYDLPPLPHPCQTGDNTVTDSFGSLVSLLMSELFPSYFVFSPALGIKTNLSSVSLQAICRVSATHVCHLPTVFGTLSLCATLSSSYCVLLLDLFCSWYSLLGPGCPMHGEIVSSRRFKCSWQLGMLLSPSISPTSCVLPH